MENKHVLVIGAGGAIGAAIVARCLERGHRALATTRSGINGTLALDVRDDASVRNAMARARESLERIDALIYVPAVTDRDLVHVADVAVWQDVYDVNVLGALRVAKALLPHFMKQRDGTLLFVSSIGATRAVVGSSAYAASKAALSSLARSIAKEYGRFNVRAFTVMPGYVDGGLLKDLEPARVKEASKQIALRRFARVEEIAQSIVASLDIPYLTATSIFIDGGIDG